MKSLLHPLNILIIGTMAYAAIYAGNFALNHAGLGNLAI